MVCTTHPDRPAIAQCKRCGAYVCKECAERTSAAKEAYGTLCLNCYREVTQETIDYYNKRAKKKITSATISLICYIIGIILVALNSTMGPITILLGLLFMGGYCAIAGWKLASKSINEGSADYVITDTGIYRDHHTWLKVILFIIGLVFGIFITPINIIRWYIGGAREKKKAKMFITELDETGEFNSTANTGSIQTTINSTYTRQQNTPVVRQTAQQVPRSTATQNATNASPTTKNSAATASLVLSLISYVGLYITGIIPLLGTIFGFVGLSRAKTTGTGKGMSIAGIIFGIMSLIAFIGTVIGLVFVYMNVTQ